MILSRCRRFSRWGTLWAPVVAFLISAASSTFSSELFPMGTGWLYREGLAEASAPDPAAWRGQAFSPIGWVSARAPLFYGEPLSGAELTGMRGNYSSVFLRKSFSINNPAKVASLRLRVICDDGFIAWINGREAARYNMPDGEPAWDGVALGSLVEPVAEEDFEFPDAHQFLTAGENILAVQVFNASIDGDDLLFDASLGVEVDNDNPLEEEIIPAPGSGLRELFAIEVRFSETVRGVDASDLLVAGTAATNVIEVAAGQFLFSFPQPADGTIGVEWAPGHGIADRLGIHPFSGSSWTYRLEASSPAPGVIISEFMADNDETLNDEDGDDSDWIELYNSGSAPADLSGWHLSDDPANLKKWRFPEYTLPENAYLVVFASEKNKTDAAGRLHTNFKLSPDGEYLALVTPAGQIASEFRPTPPRQYEDVSYGRVPGSPQHVGYMVKPTPGGPNASSGPGFAPEPVFSHSTGPFLAPFDLRLSTPNAAATIRFTLDGNLPTNSSPVYLAPIRITNSVQVRARVYQDGLLPGPPRGESFLALSNNVVEFTSDLPVIVMHTLGKGSPTSSRQTMASFTLYEPVNGVASITNSPSFHTRAAIKLRGSSTEGLPKSSFAVEFWDEFNGDEDLELLGLPADSDWVLYAPNQYDPVLIHNPFIHQLSRDIGTYSPRTRFVEVYLNRTGGPVSAANYNGIYVLEEKIKIGKDRVNIDKLQPEHAKEPEVSGGYLFKVDRLDPGDSGFSGGGQSLAYVDPKEREIRAPQRLAQRQYIKNYLDAFGRALNGVNWLDPKVGYAAYIDLDNWIEFHIVEVLSGNVDAIVLSTYLHKPRGGKITYGPHWDFDRALGSTDGRDSNPRMWNTGPFFNGWWGRLMRDRDAWQKWVDRYQQLRGTYLSRTHINGLIDRLANEVRQAQPRERAKWRVTLRGGSYQTEVDRMKNWVSNRLDFIDRQMAQPPVLSASGGRVTPGFAFTLAGPANASVYYTLDGTDPRLPQGELSPKAILYNGPITVAESVRVIARSRDLAKRQTGGPPSTTPWSAPATATFTVAPSPLAITEIMFNPAPWPSTPGGGFGQDDFEFVEIKNISLKPVPLDGYHFSRGIEFTFGAASLIREIEPGERIVVVKNKAAFTSRYPLAGRIAGEFTKGLSDASERLTILGPLLEPIADVAYNDQQEPLADGLGFSLVAREEINPADLNHSIGLWRLSAESGGSPGQADPIPTQIPPVFVHELHPNPGTISGEALELFNPNTAAVDVTGWFVSDDFRNPHKFRIPRGSIAGGGFLVISGDAIRADPKTGFGFSKFGDEVYLFSASADGVLTGWHHGFAYGPVDRGVSLGRHVNSLGVESFAPQSQPSLGAPNAPLKVGPLVLSEILFHPPANESANNTTDEFIELHNLSAEPVLLFDPARPENTWRLRGAVDYDFPPGARLGAGDYMVVVSFDPARDGHALGAFRSRYGLAADAAIVGPWQGRLDNAGDTVRLLKPGEPILTSAASSNLEIIQTSYVAIDEVTYSPAYPWPGNTSGTGRSLRRGVNLEYAGDPLSWTDALPTPGDGDADLDGLPDRWELARGLNIFSAAGRDGADGDPDQDGTGNREEFLAGTDPRDPSDFLTLGWEKEPGGKTILRFLAAPGRSYTVQIRDQWQPGEWRPFRYYLAPPEGGLAAFTDPQTNKARYYRLRMP